MHGLITDLFNPVAYINYVLLFGGTVYIVGKRYENSPVNCLRTVLTLVATFLVVVLFCVRGVEDLPVFQTRDSKEFQPEPSQRESPPAQNHTLGPSQLTVVK